MARSKEFDVDNVLGKAVTVFGSKVMREPLCRTW